MTAANLPSSNIECTAIRTGEGRREMSWKADEMHKYTCSHTCQPPKSAATEVNEVLPVIGKFLKLSRQRSASFRAFS